MWFISDWKRHCVIMEISCGLRIIAAGVGEAGAANWCLPGGSSVWRLGPPEPPESNACLDSSSSAYPVQVWQMSLIKFLSGY